MPRFVVLRHEMPDGAARPSHWDFMLESGESLRTWALVRQPDLPEPQIAEALADHRLAYLEYEGEVSDGRGRVTRWDVGSYELLDDARSPPPALSIRLKGIKLTGIARIFCAADGWRFEFSAEASS